MIRQLACVLLLMVGGVAHVQAEQGCPYPSAIKYVDGYFQATAGTLVWQSPKIGHRAFFDQFIGAIFTPGREQDRDGGYIDKCSYLTNEGQRVDLRYGRSGEVETMSLTDTLHWRLASDPFDLPVYICQDSQPDNCSFSVKKPKT
jgi:hypothetical protein